MAEWLIRIVGKQRKEIDIDLVVQAVIALGHQLAEEARQPSPPDKARPREANDDHARPDAGGAA
jgi:hypothetical protein